MKNRNKIQNRNLDNMEGREALVEVWNIFASFQILLCLAALSYLQGWQMPLPYTISTLANREAVALILFFILSLSYVFLIYPVASGFVKLTKGKTCWAERIPYIWGLKLKPQHPFYRSSKFYVLLSTHGLSLYLFFHCFVTVIPLSQNLLHDLISPGLPSQYQKTVYDRKSKKKVPLTQQFSPDPMQAFFSPEYKDRFRIGSNPLSAGFTFWPFWEVWLMLTILIADCLLCGLYIKSLFQYSFLNACKMGVHIMKKPLRNIRGQGIVKKV